jgi:hypothetical protein
VRAQGEHALAQQRVGRGAEVDDVDDDHRARSAWTSAGRNAAAAVDAQASAR